MYMSVPIKGIVHDSTMHVCGASVAGFGVLTYNPDVLRLTCKQRNAHACVVNAKTDTEEKKLFNKVIILVFFHCTKSILVVS